MVGYVQVKENRECLSKSGKKQGIEIEYCFFNNTLLHFRALNYYKFNILLYLLW